MYRINKRYGIKVLGILLILFVLGLGVNIFLMGGDDKAEQEKIVRAGCQKYVEIRGQSIEAKKNDPSLLQSTYARFGKDLPQNHYQMMFLHHLSGGDLQSKMVGNAESINEFNQQLDRRSQALYQVSDFQLLPFEKAIGIFSEPEFQEDRKKLFIVSGGVCD